MQTDTKNKNRHISEMKEAIKKVMDEEKNKPMTPHARKPMKTKHSRNEEIMFTTTPTGTEST